MVVCARGIGGRDQIKTKISTERKKYVAIMLTVWCIFRLSFTQLESDVSSVMFQSDRLPFFRFSSVHRCPQFFLFLIFASIHLQMPGS